MANVGPVLWFADSVAYAAVTAWATGTAKAAGALIRQNTTPTVGNERVFVCIVAGTTHATTEPTWTVTKGAKTTDNTVTWQECTGQPGVNGNTADSPTWTQNKNTALSLGQIIYTSGTASLQIVSTAGTSGNGSEPSFSATAGVTTADNTVTWTSLGLASNFAAWAAPFARVQSAVATNWMVAGNSLFIGDDHAETQAAAMSLSSQGTSASPQNIYSIDHTGAATLAAATLKSGASITTTGANNLSVQVFASFYGVTFSAGSGAVTSQLIFGVNAYSAVRLENCALVKAGTSAQTASISFYDVDATLINTTMQFGNTGDSFGSNTASFIWRNTSSAIAGATLPTTLFKPVFGMDVYDIQGVDLSALTSGKTIFGAASAALRAVMLNCKLGASVTHSASQTVRGARVDVVSCDSAGTNYVKSRTEISGAMTYETVVVRTGGSSNGTTSISDKIVTTASALWLFPFQDQPIAIWNSVTSTNRVVTLYGVWNAAAVPNNDEIWIEAEYFGSASSPQASFANNTKANNLAAGSALTADSTSAWDSLVTARANTTAYSVGDVRKVASNPGRIFFCTTAGTSSGSEPAGYASAVDGGSVTDNTAVFRAACRFVLTVTLSSPQPAMAGPIYVTVNAAKVSSTFYVDQKVNLS